MDRADKVQGALIGMAVGDSLGLPYEGMSPTRIARFLKNRPLRHRFLGPYGMFSDDTEHACLTAQALLAHPDSSEAFAYSLGRRFKGWLLGIPASVGWGTLRATLKLWAGVPPTRSGVHSAGNGPTLRAVVIGICFGEDRHRLREFIRASTRVTHRDPRAEQAALAIAIAVRHATRAKAGSIELESLWSDLIDGTDEEGFKNLLVAIKKALEEQKSVRNWALELGLGKGVTGYAYHTVPVALYAWLRHPNDFEAAIEQTVRLGGDTDTTAALVGALVGTTVGRSNIPAPLIKGIAEWPRSVGWIDNLAIRLQAKFDKGATAPRGPLKLFWPGLALRNFVFNSIVLGHVFRRMMPPY